MPRIAAVSGGSYHGERAGTQTAGGGDGGAGVDRVGSVGRCGAFDAGFLPVCSCSAERWRRVYEAFLEGKTLSPVELHKVSGAYFVVEGNHRVSVARLRGVAAVDTIVTEFAYPVAEGPPRAYRIGTPQRLHRIASYQLSAVSQRAES